MPKPAWESLDAFFSTNDFASSITITPQAGDPFEVPGIFDDPYLNAELGEYDMDTNQPRIWCKESDVSQVKAQDTVTINEKIYDILSNPEPDGTGLAMLRLAEAPIGEEDEEEETP